MFLTIRNTRDGEIYVQRRLAPNERIDPEHHARRWARSDAGLPLDFTPGGHIPAGCADVEVEITHTKESPGSCWSRADYFFAEGQ